MKLTERFDRALSYSFELHSGQTRKGNGVPYMTHLLAVCATVLEHGADEDEAIAALLHDAIEDQGGDATRQEIRRRFGPRVTAIVDGCTDTDATPKPPWRDRKEAYLAHLPHASRSVRLISVADKLHNAQCILRNFGELGDELWARFRGGKQGTMWYYRELVAIFSRTGPEPVASELIRVIAELEHLVAQSDRSKQRRSTG